jgi:RES domain-containing protein
MVPESDSPARKRTSALRRAIQRSLPYLVKFDGTVCRAVSIRYANSSDMLTGKGAKLTGGRWNPEGYSAVYTSLDPYAALAETLGTYGNYNIPFAQRMPLVLVGIEVVLHRVLDLRDSKQRRRLGVAVHDLLENNWQSAGSSALEALTQTTGRLAMEERVEGLLVPSARLKKEGNLVVFPEHFAAESAIRIINRHLLPESR